MKKVYILLNIANIVKKLQEDGLLVKDLEVVRMTKRGLFLGDSVADQFHL